MTESKRAEGVASRGRPVQVTSLLEHRRQAVRTRHFPQSPSRLCADTDRNAPVRRRLGEGGTASPKAQRGCGHSRSFIAHNLCHNRVAVEFNFERLFKIASQARQRWAGGHNRFGIAPRTSLRPANAATRSSPVRLGPANQTNLWRVHFVSSRSAIEKNLLATTGPENPYPTGARHRTVRPSGGNVFRMPSAREAKASATGSRITMIRLGTDSCYLKMGINKALC